MPTMKILVLFIAFFLCTNCVDWSNVSHAANLGIQQGFFPGGVLAVINKTSTIYKKAFGTMEPVNGFYSAPMSVDNYFDLNRLT